MGLREQYPQLFAEWEAAGGKRSFELHLSQIGVRPLPPKEEAELIQDALHSAVAAHSRFLDTLPF